MKLPKIKWIDPYFARKHKNFPSCYYDRVYLASLILLILAMLIDHSHPLFKIALFFSLYIPAMFLSALYNIYAGSLRK